MDNSTTNLTQVCRVCLVACEGMHSLFSFIQFDDNLKKPVYLHEMLMSVSSMKISAEDHLPTKVCTNCKQLAHSSYKFQQQCNRSQEILGSYLCDQHFAAKDASLNLADEKNTRSSGNEDLHEDSGFDNNASMKVEVDDSTDTSRIAALEENEEIREDSGFGDNVFVKVEVDGPTHTLKTATLDEDDVLAQQELTTEQLEGKGFGNSIDISYEDPEFEFMECTPSEIAVPAKSSSVYQAAYQKFIKWCEEKNLNNYSETTLLAYFSELSTRVKMKSSTMWSQYSMIKPLLNIEHGVDISTYLTLRAYLKKQNEGYTPKKSRVFTKGQLDKFLTEASDERYLGIKIVLVIGISGACRCEDMVKLKIDNIEDLGSLLHIKIFNNKPNVSRSFVIVREDFINIYRKYASLRPEGMNDRRFFVKYGNGKCHRLVMGKHKIGSVPREVASYLKLPNWKEYTGHCLRLTSAALDRETGVSRAKRQKRWKYIQPNPNPQSAIAVELMQNCGWQDLQL